MNRLACACALLLLAAQLGTAQAQAPDLENIYVELAPDASPEVVDQARRMVGALQTRTIPGSRTELWRVPAGRLGEALSQARQAPGLSAADISGGDYRSLFVDVEAEIRLSEEQVGRRASIEADPGLRATRLARLRAGALAALPLVIGFGERDGLPAGRSFMLELRPGLSVIATRRSLQPNADFTLWSGGLADPETRTPAGAASLVIRGDELSGLVSTASGTFSIRPLGGGVHAISQVAPPSRIDSDGPRKPRPPAAIISGGRPTFALPIRPADRVTSPRPRPNGERGGAAAVDREGRGMTEREAVPMAGPNIPIVVASEALAAVEPPTLAASTGPAVIHLGVAYTARAAKRLRGQSGLSPEAEIASAIEMANSSFVNSNINVVLKLADTRQTADSETDEMEAEVRALIDRKDRRYDDLPAWRRQIGANAVILIVADTNRCGLGPAIPAIPAEAFAVVREDCLRTLTIPHELGHLLGARHDDDPEDAPFPYGRGFVASQVFQTIMGNSTTETRAAIWAGPNIRWHDRETRQDFATGNAERHNDARVISEQARIFATYRD